MIRQLSPEDLIEFEQQKSLQKEDSSAIPESTNLANQPNYSKTNDAQNKELSGEGSASNKTELDLSTQEPSVVPPLSFNNSEYIEEIPAEGYEAIPYDSYIEMLAFYDEQVNKGTVKLHPWQIEIGEFISKYPATNLTPLKFALCAANGSGKDSFMVAPFAVWFTLTKIKARVVITSSSGVQLTAQTETYIRNLCETINKFWNQKIFKINQRYIKCLKTGSEIRMFATDEAGKAEGYHPIEPNRAFAIIANEAKSIAEPIFAALKRCNGFTHYIKVSSPGEPIGSFHRVYTDVRLRWKTRRVTSYDCTHIPRSEIEEDKIELGEHSALFRSKHLALFTSIGGQVIITDDKWNKNKEYCKTWLLSTTPIRVGLDLAAGGDETTLSAWRGNKRVYQYTFVEQDTELAADIIDRELTSLGLAKDHDYIKADDGGIGRGIIDKLVRKGWINIRRILNNSQARDKKMYGNKGAEMWYNFLRLVEECLILQPLDGDGRSDEKFETQLTTRHYKDLLGGSRIFLQTKKEAKSEGHPSPDRADAAMLALEDLRVQDFLNARDGIAQKPKTKSSNAPTLEEIVKQQDNKRYAYHEALDRGDFANIDMIKNLTIDSNSPDTKPKGRSCGGSLDCALN